MSRRRHIYCPALWLIGLFFIVRMRAVAPMVAPAAVTALKWPSRGVYVCFRDVPWIFMHVQSYTNSRYKRLEEGCNLRLLFGPAMYPVSTH
ncbi:hypothetical protein C2E23DRAFT_823313 [Lenzites betulinus]|nr:hypothetical protein C2E23DRAFT_823313 [Lenzites betulinus]